MKRYYIIGMALLLTATTLYADATDKVRDALLKLAPGMQISSIKPAAVDGFYEVLVDMQVVYVSADGKYLMQGRLMDIDTGKDLTEPTVASAKAGVINAIKDEDTIIFAPKDYKHTVTIFTDIDCPYCARLHQEMDQYMDAGIRVRYLFFPRAGIDSGSYKKALSVWCAEDQQQAMTRSKAGQMIPEKSCDSPIKSQMELVSVLGIRGTPAIYTEQGEQLGGYLPISQIAARLNAKEIAK